MTHYAKNIVTDYGAPTNGTSDTSVAWDGFIAFLGGLVAGDDVTLTVPNAGAGGSNIYAFHRAGGGMGINLLPGILGGITVVVNMTGVTFTDGGGGSGFFLGGGGLIDDNAHSSRISTANAGVTSVTLSTPSENSRFQVNQWILITGFDTQGYGSPVNPGFFEYRKITAINAGTGLISFATPLVNQYLSTWPVYNPGAASGPNSLDCGGPATIYALPVAWDITAIYNGGTFNQNAQIYFRGRSVTFNGGGCISTFGIVPTLSVNQSFIDFDQSVCGIEVDKAVETLIYTRSPVSQLAFQSMSCATNCIVTDSVVTTYNGTPRNLTISGGSTASLQTGPSGYGRADSLTVNNCVVSAVIANAVSIQDIVSLGYTMSSGVIRVPRTQAAVTWAVPGTWCFFRGSRSNENAVFRVLAVTDDGTNTVIVTTLNGGFPIVPLRSGLYLDLVVHPCPVWKGFGNSGCADIIDLNNAGAQSKPLFSYSNRTYTGNTLPNASTFFPMWGQLSAVNVNVTQAYTGTQSTLTAEMLGQFGGDFLSVDRTTVFSYNPILNLKQTGTRNITPTVISAQSGDTLGSAPGTVWFAGSTGMFANHVISGEASGLWPIFSIEIIADQNLNISSTRGFNRWRNR